jgi:cyanophycinase
MADRSIDQHFVAQFRNNRLLTVVIETELVGIGINEGTAIIYFPDDTFKVYGNSSVVVYDPRRARIPEALESKRLTIENVRLSVLKDGQVFNMKRAKVRDST